MKNRKLSLAFKDKLTKKENLKSCFEFELPEDYITQDHDLYFFLSAYSGPTIAQGHVIHNVRFWDTNHVHDDQDQDTADDRREFHANPHDVVRERVMKSEQQYTSEAYNQQVILHNRMYSKLVSEFIANSEMILKLLESMPQHDVIRSIQQEANQISSRFSLMEEQFTTYDRQVTEYKDYIKKILVERATKRGEGNTNNPANKEQKEIMDSLGSIQTVISQYQTLMSNNHLIE